MEKFIHRKVVDLVRGIRDRRVSRVSPNLPEVSVVVDSDAIDGVALDVIQVADTNTLSMLIRDPEEPGQYWYRKIQIKRSGTQDAGDGKQVSYVDFVKVQLRPNIPEYAMYPYDGATFADEIPLPERTFKIGLRWILDVEEKLRVHPDPELRSLYASVAVAEYHGQDSATLDSLLTLTAVKFSRMRIKEK